MIDAPSRRAALRFFRAAPALAILPTLALPAAATATAAVPTVPTVPAVDPVYAMIAAHKRALAAFNVVCTKYEDVDLDEMTPDQDEEYDQASLAEDEAVDAVGRTLPTTRDGALQALLTVCSNPHRGDPIGMFFITLIDALYPEGADV